MVTIYKLLAVCIGIALILFLFIAGIRFALYKLANTSPKSTKISKTLKGSGLSKEREAHGFIFGTKGQKKVFLPETSEGHISVFGGSGKGKTAALLIPSLRSWCGSFFVIDISGDISRNVECDNKVILAPDNPAESSIYNIFHLIDSIGNVDEQREKIEQLVNIVIDKKPNASDATIYFTDTARKIFRASMVAFYSIGWDFIQICRQVYFTSYTELWKQIELTEHERAIGYIESLRGESDKNLSGAKSHLDEKIRIFADNPKMAKILRRPVFDGEASIYPAKLEDMQLFLKIPDKKQDYYSPFMRIISGQIMEYISGREYNKDKDKRILVALDEFASIGHFEVLSPFRKFRKNGANICILTQSLADIDLVYSEKERRVILDNSGYIVVLSANDSSTRQYFSELVGREPNFDKRGNEKRDFAVQPEKWKEFENHLIVIHAGGYVRLKKNFYFNERKRT